MPKLLVLVSGAAGAHSLAEAVARGASAVRFTEVSVRRLASGPDKESPEPHLAKYRMLDADEKLTDHDALVLVGDESGAQRLATFLDGVGPLRDQVGAVVLSPEVPAERGWPLSAALGRQGMILLSGSEDPDSLGRRAATVAGWVRHAKSHEGGTGHHHHH